MSNLQVNPDEVLCPAGPHTEPHLIEPREVPLGGIRSMTVRRTLPARGHPFVGHWCFADHYGPDDVATTGGMDVPPHPHCGLATVSWLFRGEIEHRDSLGTRALVLPGEMNLMTAGGGIAHSEVSTRATTILHGVQLWLALPPEHRDIDPSFQHFAPAAIEEAGITWRVFLGAVGAEASPVPTHAPVVGAQIDLAASTGVQIPLEADFEHGILVDTGAPRVDAVTMAPGQLAVFPPGRTVLRVEAGEQPSRLLLLGGAPMTSDLIMWWNFVGGSHEEIAAARRDWQAEMGFEEADGATSRRRFGSVLGYHGGPLPAPVMPGGRLRPRRP